ncbi:MAG: FG-GAP-like repeat-containing protein, partial [Halobacteriales archaeon]|nr:FG-GAP-like repeat-containing protein [Halobacteriales archaeon]
GVRGSQCGAELCWGTSATWLDYDRDGCLDLYVDHYGEYNLTDPPPADPDHVIAQPNLLFRNGCDGTFTDATAAANLTVSRHSWSSVAVDLDADGWADLYVADDSEPNEVWRNQGDGTFHLDDGAAAADARHSMGSAAADLDLDGRMDLVTTNFIREMNGVFLAQAGGGWFDIGSEDPFRGAEGLSGWATQAVDVHNDGQPDLMVLDGDLWDATTPVLAYEGIPGAGWQDMADDIGFPFDTQFTARGGAWGDYDNDGDTDVLVLQAGEKHAALLRSDAAGGNFLTLYLVGTGASNRDAVGARVTVHAAGLADQVLERQAGAGFLGSNDPRLHAGLADAERADVTVRWPDGTLESHARLRANTFYRLTEGSPPQVLRALPLLRVDAAAAAQRLADVAFAASDADGSGFAQVAWDFGDGAQASGGVASHAFGDVGPAFVRARATDAGGLAATHTHRVLVQDALQAEVALDAARLLLPTERATGNVTVRFSDGAPVHDADVALAITYTTGIAPLDALMPQLPKAVRDALGFTTVEFGGATDAAGRYAFTAPWARQPTGLVALGLNQPGHYLVRAHGGARGSVFPDVDTTFDVGPGLGPLR